MHASDAITDNTTTTCIHIIAAPYSMAALIASMRLLSSPTAATPPAGGYNLELHRLIDQFNDHAFDSMAPVSPRSDTQSNASPPLTARARSLPRSLSAGRLPAARQGNDGSRSVAGPIDANRSVELLYSLGAARAEKLQ